MRGGLPEDNYMGLQNPQKINGHHSDNLILSLFTQYFIHYFKLTRQINHRRYYP